MNEVEYTISLRDVSKVFRRYQRTSGYTTIKSLLLSLFKKRSEVSVPETVALDEITLRVPKGASYGVIGKNGSGKSTLLKLITGIYKPDTGTIDCSGRISALIELGAGFHPDFTGRENVYLGGMIQGLNRQQIDERFDEIVEFAELEDFIDEPVRTYSSGMFMRLGFSLAIHSDPDVLLIDEVLAVGDEGFISKCKAKISALKEQGVTLMLVTHDLAAVERWCDEVLWLHKGEVKDRGEPRRVIDAYREFIDHEEEERLEAENAEIQQADADDQPQGGTSTDPLERWGSREVEIAYVRLLDESGAERFVFKPNESCTVEIEYLVREPLEHDLVCGIAVHHSDGTMLFGTNTDIEEVKLPDCGTTAAERGVIRCEIERLSLLTGDYWFDIAVHRDDGYPYDYWKRCIHFSLRSNVDQVGKVHLSTSWDLERSVAEEDSLKSVG